MNFKIVILVMMAVLISSCSVINYPRNYDQNSKTQLQSREYQTRTVDTNDTKLVLKAVLNVLQDDGFIVKNAVVDLGLLSATKEVDLAGNDKNGFWDVFFDVISKDNNDHGDRIFSKTKIVEATINVSGYSNQSKIRASFQAKILDNKGNTVEVYAVDDAKYYQDFFAKIDKGIFLQKQGL